MEKNKTRVHCTHMWNVLLMWNFEFEASLGNTSISKKKKKNKTKH
jgi:hypothetical protein